MKKLIEITVNGWSDSVAVINYIMNAETDNEGKVIFTKPDDLIAKCKGYPIDVDIYAHPGSPKTREVHQITLTAGSIKRLYKALIKIEELESEEFWD